MNELNASFAVVLELLQKMLNAAHTIPDNHDADELQKALSIAITHTQTAQLWANKT